MALVRRDPSGDFAIRYAAVDDAVLLSSIAAEGECPLSADLIAALAADRRVFLAEDGRTGLAIGVAAAGELQGALAVETLAVVPSARLRGIGAALLGSVEAFGSWAFFPQVLAVPRSAHAEGFLSRRGYIAADPERMPPELERLGQGRPVLVKRL